MKGLKIEDLAYSNKNKAEWKYSKSRFKAKSLKLSQRQTKI